MTDRLWLDVPFAEKDAAKAAGARWDGQARRWYAPHETLLPRLERWWPRTPDVLPGEDRSYGQGLFVDLVPRSCWFTNVRSCVDPSQWDALRTMVYRRASNRCEACGAARGGDRQRLEAHERWSYDEAASTQTLRRLIALCWSCHRATHFGFAEVTGTDAEARAHLQGVNGWSPAETQAHIDEAWAIWHQRSARNWRLDLGVLTNAGIRVLEPPDPERREEVASQLPSIAALIRTDAASSRGQGQGSTEDFRPETLPAAEPARPGLWERVRRVFAGQ